MPRRLGLFIAIVGAILLACAGVVIAQTNSAQERTKPAAPSNQSTVDAAVIPDGYIVVLKDDSPGQASAQGGDEEKEAEQAADDLAQESKVKNVEHTYGSALKGFAAEISEDKVEEVRSDPRVKFVTQDREVKASAQTLPTGVDRVDADLSSAAAGNGSGATDVDIAIMDSGIYAKHSDLTIAGGKDCSTDGKNTFSDDSGHGTHVAGIAAAEDNTAGVVGTAPGARLWAVKVLNKDGSSSLSDVICGIDWVTQNASTIEVANMSFGARVTKNGTADDGNCGNTNNDAVHQAICNSVNNAKVTYVVSAGNAGSDTSNYVPASYNEVITVSALADYNGQPGGGAQNTCRQDRATDDDFAFFSNFGTDVDIGAPGVCITSTWKGSKKKKGTYKIISGTSMASPHVAGAAALYKSTHATDTPAQVRAFMLSAANTEAKGSGHFDSIGLNPEPVLQMDNY